MDIKRSSFIKWGLLVLAGLAVPIVGGLSQTVFLSDSSIVPAQYNDKSFFLSAIMQTKAKPLAERVTGLTVPHHLLARDIMARLYMEASKNNYQRVIIISPDHFHLGQTAISYATNDFATVFGRLPADTAFIQQLALVQNAQAGEFFYREHGIGAELPFIKYFFPSVKVVAIALNTNASPGQLKGLVDFLTANIGPDTLLVQSTDFSHYLTLAQAQQQDARTIELLEKLNQGQDPQSLYQLTEPDNLDCLACQYVQSVIQQKVFHSQAHIVEHKNSQSYSAEPLTSTTSYIPQIYYNN